MRAIYRIIYTFYNFDFLNYYIIFWKFNHIYDKTFIILCFQRQNLYAKLQIIYKKLKKL